MTEEELFSRAEAAARSEKKEIHAFLREYLLLSVMEGIAVSPFGESAYLLNVPEEFRGERYGDLRMAYAIRQDRRVREKDGFVPGQRIDEKFREDFANLLCGILKSSGFPEARPEGKGLLTCVLKGTRYHLFLTIVPLTEEEIFPLEEERENPVTGKRFTFYRYPAEDLLAEQVTEILTKLELIPDMTAYETAYRILKREPVEGRRFCQAIREEEDRRHLRIRDTNWHLFESYRNYGYMRRKWKTSRLRGDPVTWDEVYGCLYDFLNPIHDAMAEERIFIDTWMPELGRFM